ncbi:MULTISPECIES: diguanylate cyclase domain-containing protein [unclassified Nostoc]|uniref:GGDEF domain-containing response regulator n=1 Tax=unclassified Nostoc TaxID=2593658 RepID=UPI002AD2CCCD|nr:MULTISPECIES: diguanylate cyclase [unclassified Nostoc]MDZ8033466.1 diguanylate cyclase [Nostoc sp. DedSLP04]MDZ8096234.1 diguanylate cyclase [Nostoc sp. DedQUE05]MDZ8129143.1 diguanylate cyclase [Nostoc sp. DedQUE07]MDZ8140506.1 diguanylate cyclase [Nostoc sp. DedQUE04]
MFARKILIVEDEKNLASNIRKSLQKLGYLVSEITESGEEAIKKVAENHPHLVLIDICLAGEIDGFHVADIIQNHFHVPVVYLTEYSEYKRLHKNQLSEPFSYIAKPFIESDLHFVIEMTLYKHQSKKILYEEKQRLMAIINSMGCAVIVTYANGCIEMMNPIAELITGWKQSEALGKDLIEVVNLVNKDVGEKIENLATYVIEAGEIFNLPENCTLITKDGKEIAIGDNVAPIRDRDGNITGAVLVFQDITKRKQTEAQLIRNAFYDGLTELPNRVLFLDRLRQTIERSKRRSDYYFAVLFLDLDGFKEINDRFGHGIGDDFLVAIARRLESCLRSGDTVARFGGDEFTVLLEDIKDITDATNVAKRIQDSLRLPVNLNGYQLSATASIGITWNFSNYEEPATLLRDADIAMYQAKRQGKATYAIFS